MIYRESNNFFTVNGRPIKRFKTINDNGIKNGDNICLFITEE